MCLEKVKASPDDRKTSRLVTCAKSGYGILENGAWIKLDKAGNDTALAALKGTSKEDHIRADVTGELSDDTSHVSKLTIPD